MTCLQLGDLSYQESHALFSISSREMQKTGLQYIREPLKPCMLVHAGSNVTFMSDHSDSQPGGGVGGFSRSSTNLKKTRNDDG